MNHGFTKPLFLWVTQTLRLHAHNKKFQILNISLDVLHFLRLSRRQNSQNPYFYKVTRPKRIHVPKKPLVSLAKMNRNSPTTRPPLHEPTSTFRRAAGHEEANLATIKAEGAAFPEPPPPRKGKSLLTSGKRDHLRRLSPPRQGKALLTSVDYCNRCLGHPARGPRQARTGRRSCLDSTPRPFAIS